MNQILMVENNKSKKNKKEKKKKTKMPRGTNTGPIEIKNIIRFFAVVIILFSLCIIGHSSYAMYVDAKGNNTDDLPKVTITRKNDTLIVNVESVYVIDEFNYFWQNSEMTTYPENSTSVQREIVLPSENNMLTIVLEDETGRAVTYTKEIILDGIDITKPSIDIAKQETSVRITANDETGIEYMMYRIDDGQDIRIDKNAEGDTSSEYALTEQEIGRGEHTVYVTAIDTSGNTEEAESTIIISAERPTIRSIDIESVPGKIIIDAADADGIQSIEVNLNGQVYLMNDVNRTEARFSLDLVQGTNTISIKLTNVNGLSAEGSTEFNYAG